MITTRVPGGIRVVMQTDHQSQCGLIAARWGNRDFPRMEPWEPVLCAAEWHDEGWRQWERTPGIMDDGTPRGFAQMDLEDHVAIHRRSIAAARNREPVAAMLVGMHCVGLLQRRLGLHREVSDTPVLPASARALIDDERVVRAARTAKMGDQREAEEWTWAAYRVLQAIDLVSLYLTWRGLAHGEAWTLRQVPRAGTGSEGADIAVTPVDHVTCALDPWPFADTKVDAPVLGRIIPNRTYSTADDLGTAIRHATPAAVPFRIVPAMGQ